MRDLHFHSDGRIWQLDDVAQIFTALDGLYGYAEAMRILGERDEDEELTEAGLAKVFAHANVVGRPEVRHLSTESSMVLDLVANAVHHPDTLGVMYGLFKVPSLILNLPVQYVTKVAEYHEARVRIAKAKAEREQLAAAKFQAERRDA